jgi:Rv2525c-like, glycoside hydrolase-like domain
VSERKALHGAGLAIGLVWEGSGTDALRGAQAGAQDGNAARAQAAALGAPRSTAIYAALDFDVQPDQEAACNAYLRAFAHACRPYWAGLYGGLYAVAELGHLAVPYRWQTLAWSSGRWSTLAHVRQTAVGVSVGAVSCDEDLALEPCGLWLP